MAQQPREENSVLFSLKELRRMEDDRIRQEHDDRTAKAEAERQERQAAERRAVEEAERLRREETERAQRAVEEKENRSREEQMRLAEAERRARIEGEHRLQHERMRLEIQSRKHSSPMKAIAVAVGVMVLLGGALFFKLNADSEAKLEAQRADQIRKEQEFAKREQESQKKFQAMVDQKTRELATAKSDEERNRIRKEMDDEREKERARRARTPTRPSSAPANRPASPPSIKKPRDINDDPLDGLKL
jgi:hypothetical protein